MPAAAAAQGPFPLVMVSPGATVYGDASLFLGTRLASHGHVVAVVEPFNELQWLDSGFDGFLAAIHRRPRDLSFALTELLGRSGAAGDLLHGAIDPRRVVAAGHSFGGYTALALLGGDDEPCGAFGITDGATPEEVAAFCQATPADPRFTAVVSLDGSGDLLRYHELSRIQAPSLVMGQANWADVLFFPDRPEDLTFVARPHAAMAPAGHSVRVDLTLENPGWLPNHMAFLDAEVRASPAEAARRLLTQADASASEAGVELWREECCSGDPTCGSATATTFSYHKDPQPAASLVGTRDPVLYFP